MAGIVVSRKEGSVWGDVLSVRALDVQEFSLVYDAEDFHKSKGFVKAALSKCFQRGIEGSLEAPLEYGVFFGRNEERWWC